MASFSPFTYDLKNVPAEVKKCHTLHETMEVSAETGPSQGCLLPGMTRRCCRAGEASPPCQKLSSCTSVSGNPWWRGRCVMTVFLQEDLYHCAGWHKVNHKILPSVCLLVSIKGKEQDILKCFVFTMFHFSQWHFFSSASQFLVLMRGSNGLVLPTLGTMYSNLWNSTRYSATPKIANNDDFLISHEIYEALFPP